MCSLLYIKQRYYRYFSVSSVSPSPESFSHCFCILIYYVDKSNITIPIIKLIYSVLRFTHHLCVCECEIPHCDYRIRLDL